VIAFDAIVYKVQTLVDGGIRVTLDLPEHAIEAATELMRYKRDEVALRVGVAANGEARQETD
jgi:hypothetical protein